MTTKIVSEAEKRYFSFGKKIKGLRGVVHSVRRTSNTEDRRRRSGKEPFPDGN